MPSVRTPHLEYVETVTGNYNLPRDAHDDIIVKAIKSNRIYDAEIVEVAGRYIRPGSTVLDVGANFGQMSILFSNFAGVLGRVYSFDADDFVFNVLTRNIEANGKQQQIVPVFGAVHDVPDQMLYFPVQDFVHYGSYGSYGIDLNASSGRQVRSLTIDSLDILEPISFMKIDVQGADLRAMQGAVRTINRNKMPIVFEYEFRLEDEFNMCFQDYVDFVTSIGYRFLKVINGQNYLVVPK
jgi:FkbM family methyltransferase